MLDVDCIFCKIARREVDSKFLYRDDRIYVIKDIRPISPVHLLIIPIQHITSLAYVGSRQSPMMGHIFTVAEEMARREGITVSGYRLVMNQGSDSGQSVTHIHMNLIGGTQLAGIG